MTVVATRLDGARPLNDVTAANSGAPSELLEPPGLDGNGGAALLALHGLLLSARGQSLDSARARIDAQESIAKKAIKDAFEACLVKIEAEADANGFWADVEGVALDVGKWAAVAGSVALAVVSCGAATPIAVLAVSGAVLSCAAAADSTFGILQALGASQEAATWINVGMSIGGAVSSGGAGLAVAVESATAKTGELSARTGEALERGARAGGAVGSLVGAGATAAGAVARAKVASFECDAELAEADERGAENVQRRAEARVQALLGAMREVMESQARGRERIGEAIADYQATSVALMRA